MPTARATHAALVATLLADTAVAEFIGTDGIYFGTVPAGRDLPFVAYQQISSSPDQSHAGASAATERTYQFSCHAETAAQALELRDAIIAALDGVALSTGETPTLQDERDGPFDEAVETFRADCDFAL